MPGIGFGIVKVDFRWIKWLDKTPILSCSEKSRFRIQQMFPTGCSAGKRVGQRQIGTAVFQTRFGASTLLMFLRQLSGHVGYTCIVVSVLQRFGNRFGFRIGRNKPISPVGRQASRRTFRTGYHGLERTTGIKIAIPFIPRIGNHRYGMVPDHAVGFVVGQFPNGQSSAAIGVIQHSFYYVGIEFRPAQAVQGMCSPVGIPKRENGIRSKVLRLACLVSLVVHAAKTPIHIGKQVGCRQGVINGGIKNGSLSSSAAANRDPGKRFPPNGFGLTAQCSPVKGGDFCSEIAGGSFQVYGGNCNLEEDRIRLGCRRFSGKLHDRFIALMRVPAHIAVGFQLKVHLLIQRPGIGDAKATYGVLRILLDGGLADEVAVIQIDGQCGVGGVRRIDDAVKSRPIRCGNFDLNAVLQKHLIVTRANHFIAVAKSGSKGIGFEAIFGSIPGKGHQQYVAVIAHTRST